MPVTQADLDRCVDIAREFGVTRLILFGSALESPALARDLDLACEGVDGWELFRLGAKLEEALRIPVDLVPLDPHNRFSRHIAAKGRLIYAVA